MHHACAHYSFLESGRTKALIEEGSDLLFDGFNPLALGQNTPVHIAAENQSTKSLRILLFEKGVNCYLEDINKKPPEGNAKYSD